MKEKRPISLRLSDDVHRRLRITAVTNSTTLDGMIEKALDAFDEKLAWEQEKPKKAKKKTPRRR